jgi:hypothetical protein
MKVPFQIRFKHPSNQIVATYKMGTSKKLKVKKSDEVWVTTKKTISFLDTYVAINYYNSINYNYNRY